MKGRSADLDLLEKDERIDILASEELLQQLSELRARLTKQIRDWRRKNGLCGEGTCKCLRFNDYAYCIRHLQKRREASLRFQNKTGHNPE